VWLKFDTGMHRLGLNEEEFRQARARLADLSGIRQPVPVMTHLANAEVPEDPATAQQLRRFHAVVPATAERAIANSAGLLAWEGSHVEWVRPGIALYGVSPFPARTGSEEGLRPVMTLETRIIAIKELRCGDAVGYGGEFVCRRLTRAGVAAIGYGDGYPRSVPTGTPVLVRGKRVPLIGRVSMDLISIDLTDCPEVEVADRVTLWGEGLPVEEIARWAGTIPYVLLCNITQRVDPVEIHGLESRPQ
jgi:alanine racemase